MSSHREVRQPSAGRWLGAIALTAAVVLALTLNWVTGAPVEVTESDMRRDPSGVIFMMVPLVVVPLAAAWSPGGSSRRTILAAATGGLMICAPLALWAYYH